LSLNIDEATGDDVPNIYYKQLGNRNYMSPLGFDFSIARFPKVSFFSNSASIPEISIGGAEQANYLKSLMHPGDRVEYGELPIQFLVDEDMLNYTLIHNWITGLGFPESMQQFVDWTTDETGQRDLKLQYSDATLKVLNSNYNTIAQVKFWDLYPTTLSTLEFTATDTDINYLTANVTFNYLYFQILDKDGKELSPDYVNQALLR
jgi:hypothetical protein